MARTKEAIDIEFNDAFVEEAFRDVYTTVTRQIAGIELEPPSTRKKKIECPIAIVVLSKGTFKSKAVAQFPAGFADEVVRRMSNGVVLSDEEKDAYFKEYMNICYGRFISRINNEMGRASRFVIPVILRGTYRETADSSYNNSIEIGFGSSHGRVEIVLRYELLPEYSSN